MLRAARVLRAFWGDSLGSVEQEKNQASYLSHDGGILPDLDNGNVSAKKIGQV